MGKLKDVMAGPRPEEYVEVAEKAFAKCPKFRGLRYLSAETRDGFLKVRFEGPLDDHRGPYGIIVPLPDSANDAQDGPGPQHPATSAESVAGSVEDWADSAVAMGALEAHAASRARTRPYSRDGVWWLTRETTS